MEHTNEFLMGMFAAYMGCEVTTKYDEDGKTYKTVGVSFDEGNLQVQMPDGGTDWWNIPICKPILTPLSEITDEDAVEVAKIFKYQVNEQDKLKFLGLELVDSLVKYELDGFMLRDILAITDYLRSKKYDCGYMHIPSLIEAGLAVKSTK